MFNDFDLTIKTDIYRDAGHTQSEAMRLAGIDMQSHASDILSKDVAEPVAVEIEELVNEPIDVIDTTLEEKYETASELQAVIGACADYGMGMSDQNYRLASMIQNHLVAADVTDRVMLSLESVHATGVNPKDLMMHFEDSVGDTIKNLWAKMRQGFINSFNKIKTWYIKAFNGAARLGNKAKALSTQAQAKQGQLKSETIEMSGIKTLGVNGKAPDSNGFAQSIATLSSITQAVLGVSAPYYNKVANVLVDGTKKLIEDAQAAAPAEAPAGTDTTQAASPARGTADFALSGGKNPALAAIGDEVGKLIQAFGKDLDVWTEAAADPRFKDQAANDKGLGVDFYRTKSPLPGDKMFVITLPKRDEASTASSIADFKKAFTGKVESIAPEPKEMEDRGQFRTLTPSQVAGICDNIVTACKTAFDYKLLFAERDKAFQTLGKELDRAVAAADKLQGGALTFVKSNVSATTTIFGQINNVEGRWYRYSMGVFSKATDYCQASLSQVS